MKEAALALCQSDGRIVASDERFARLLGGAAARAVDEAAQQLGCAALSERFAAFVAAKRTQDSSFVGPYELTLRWLEGEGSLALLEISAPDEAEREQARLSEIGRLTARLLHDFKNQMGGLKLYAAYLKKKFADVPEGAEIAEKINQGLNVMAEQAALVGRLTRPLDLRCAAGNLTQLAEMAVNDLRAYAAARGVQIESELAGDVPEAAFDAQQLRTALHSILARAIDASPLGGAVQVRLHKSGDRLRLEVEDGGALLDEEQRQMLFKLTLGERLQKTTLDLALAQRIIAEHGGQITVTAAGRNRISLSFPAI